MTDRVTTGVPLIDNSNVINRSTPVAATNDITSGYTLTPLDLHFDCQKVISGRVGSRRETGEEFLLAFDDDFANDPNAVNANTLIKYNTLNSSDLSYDCTNGSMAFSSTFSGYAEAIYSTPIKLKGPVFHAVLDVLADSINFAPRVGVIKDADNWVQAVYSKLDLGTAGIEIKVGGIFTSYYGHMPAIAAPYKLHFQINNIIVSMLIEKDGKMYRLAEQNISSKVNFTDYATLKSYNLMFAVTTNALVASAGKLGGLKAGYSIGASTIQDMRPLTYEDGQPIRRNGWKYLLASTHPVDDILGAIGVKLFRFNNIKFEYIGMLFNRYGTRIFAGNSDKLMYDRNLKKWIYISGNWSDTPVTSYIGSTEEDMLKGGIFVINTAPILLPENDVVIGSYDMDIVYVNNKYRIVYAISAPALYTAIGECATFDGQYTRVIKLNNNVALREGNVFTKIGGIYYVTSSAGAGSGTSELGCYSSVDLSLVCNINTSRFPTSLGSFPSWGCIIPIVNKSTTNYMLLLFSPKKAYLTWNGTVWIPMNYGYGDLWVYESQETQPAQEFANKDLLFFD